MYVLVNRGNRIIALSGCNQKRSRRLDGDSVVEACKGCVHAAGRAGLR